MILYLEFALPGLSLLPVVPSAFYCHIHLLFLPNYLLHCTARLALIFQGIDHGTQLGVRLHSLHKGGKLDTIHGTI